MLAREALRKGVGFGIDDEIDLPLSVQGDLLVAVAGDGRKAHALEQLSHRHGIGRRIFDELEARSAHRVFPLIAGHAPPLPGPILNN